MKPIYPMLLLMLAGCASAAPISESAAIPTHAPAILVLHDQFDAPQALAFPTTNITLLTIADRAGSTQLAGWIAPVKQRFDKQIDIRGIADVSPVPRLLRSLMRKKFRELQTYPVMMDWTGDAVKAFTYVPDQANVLVLDGRGQIVLRASGPATERAVQDLCAVIERALATRNRTSSTL
jgi:hypothetical protein